MLRSAVLFSSLVMVFFKPMAMAASEEVEEALARKIGDLQRVFDKAFPKLNSLSTAPDNKAIYQLRTSTKADIRQELNKILLEAVEVLGNSDLSDLKKAANLRQRQIVEAEKEIAEFQKKKLSAPRTVGKLNFTTVTQADYEAKIRSAEDSIAQYKNDIKEIGAKLKEALSAQKIQLSSGQIEGLLYSVTGDDDIALFAVFESVKGLTLHLQKLSKGGGSTGVGENASVAKMYFGMHTLLLKALVSLHVEYLRRIDKEYVPALKTIVGKNKALVEDGQKKLSEFRSQQQSSAAEGRAGIEQIEWNLQALALTNRTAELYEKYLDLNRKRISESLSGLEQQYGVAEHTYLTVENSTQLANLMSRADFSKLLTLKVPTLQRFENKEMENQFQWLTVQLGKNR